MKALATLVACFGLVWLAAGVSSGGELDLGKYYGSSSGPFVQAPTWKVPDLTEKARGQHGKAKEVKGSDPSAKAFRNVEKLGMPVEDKKPARPYPLVYPRHYRPEMEHLQGSATYQRTSVAHIMNNHVYLQTMQGPMERLQVMQQPGVMERHGIRSAEYLQ